MARHKTSEEQKLMTVLQRLPFAAEEKQGWIETIDTSGLSEDLAKEIQLKAAGLPRPEEEDVALRQAHEVVEINNLIRRWRLGQNLPTNRRR
ncbi:MAG TPA: hypothetical protein VLH85_08470 [Levilinea sp.]|nr:hypothetical protein [Levilinea sp.]